MKIEEYLSRINLTGVEISPDLQCLKILQRNHLLNIPFENLDIHWKREIILDDALFAKKIIDGRRGGFCYELNGLFYRLLKELGFQSKIISACVSNGKGGFGAEYDHLAILTTIDGEKFLVDAGFGDFTAEPLKFELDLKQEDKNGTFLIRKLNEGYFEVVKELDGKWNSEYIFKNQKRDLAEFSGMCVHNQISPDSHFTRGVVCSLMTDNGRKTLTDKKFIKTNGGKKTEREIGSVEEFDAILKREFGIAR